MINGDGQVVIYGHRLEEGQEGYLNNLMVTLEDIGWNVSFEEAYYQIVKDKLTGDRSYSTVANHKDLQSKKPDFVITLGGDGTILKAITLVRDSGVPILGINLGRLGFLSSIEKAKIREVMLELSLGKFKVENRSLLSLECNKDIFGETKFAMNDFTITKRDDSSMVKVKTFVNGNVLNVYWADGIIVATPTGSTGYSLSCGGPIIFPQSNNFVITPIAPHNLNVRPVVLSDASVISFEIEGRAGNFLSTLDSRFESITTDHRITIRKNDFTIGLVQPAGTSFMQTINSKLMWGLDMRN